MKDRRPVLPSQRIPVSLLTGFLGSGKTTVLNRLLRQPALAGTVVIINEFGEIGLDHELVESAAEDMVLLQSGCLCCTIRGDLIDTLRGLFLKRVRGDLAACERVVIETTGLADPAPIVHTLLMDPVIAARYRLDGVITTVDAATAMQTFDRQIEAVKQAAVADRLLLTKTDLVEAYEVDALLRRLHALNPAAPVLNAANGAVDPKRLFDAGLYDPATKSEDVRRWLNAEAFAGSAQHHHDHHDHDHRDHDDQGHEVNRHDDHIKAICLTLDEPVSAAAFEAWLEALLLLKGPDLLRVKGIVNIRGHDDPVAIHGVQHLFHPPVVLKEWPHKDRRSRIVFIVRDMDEGALRDTFNMFADSDAAARSAGAMPAEW